MTGGGSIMCMYLFRGRYRTGERKAVKEMAFARGNISPARDFKLFQNYYWTVFSGLFSEFFVKRDTIQSNIQF